MSVKLSELFTTAIRPTSCPELQDMQTIASVIEKIPNASVSFRHQIEQKMKLYIQSKMTVHEMMNTLLLANYVVQNSPTFRTQVCELSFLTLLQQVGKMRKVHTETDEVEDKVRELIAVWGCFYPNELSEYAVLYQKYLELGVINPLSKPTILLPNEITRLVPHVEHNLRNVARALQDKLDMQNVLRHAVKIQVKYEKQVEKCFGDIKSYDAQKLYELEQLNVRLRNSIAELKGEVIKSGETEVVCESTSMKEPCLECPTQTISLLNKRSIVGSRAVLHFRGDSLKTTKFVSREMKVDNREDSKRNVISPIKMSRNVSSEVFVFDEEMDVTDGKRGVSSFF
ncbi:hypothetical protein EIN_095320 [Entamoeba invadens IP1]|uniref:VHS domain-containing protein n=1 Tax=Entamoeba invadens IP1 TaxID=370355 RepID=A0A0A1U067_ENTIV|nr:hypothetical protein EIN_095320 [Entamoeba invadens IP1]ELP87285.1 hypothetical protein EIN_095320 [Entamoeba invadens IP1]|eukprot:XP_004254056.1 hypothetical protein EIN_095320 [Entamoeba invadens IP1]